MNAKYILMLLLALVATVSALPVSIDSVEVEGTELLPNEVTRLDIERGNEMNVRVELTANQNINDAELMVFVSGYEYNDMPEERLQAYTSLFDLKANTTYVKTLKIVLPQEVENDDYKLRLMVTDKDGTATSKVYNLKIDSERHLLNLVDITVIPGYKVKPGQGLIVKARVENKGQKTENDVKVTATIPLLGVRQTAYIDTVKPEKQDETDEIFVKIPETATAGEYEVIVDVDYDNLHRRVSGAARLTVEALPQPVAPVAPVVQPEAPVVVPVEPVVEAKSSITGTVKLVLKGLLLVLVVLLVIIGLIVGFSRLGSE